MGRPRYQRPTVFKTSTKHGRQRWYIRVMVDVLVDRNRTERKEKTIYLGYCDEMGIREANKERDKHITTVNNTPLVVQSQVLFKDLAEAYRTTFIPGLKPSTRHTHEHRLDKHILPKFGNLRLHEIDPITIQRWVYELEDSGLARNTRQNALAVLRSIFEMASEWGYFLGRNPCKKTRVGDGGSEVYERIALDPTRALNLLQAVKDEEPLRLIVEIALFSGLRVSEILALTWGSIDFEHQTADVKQGRSQHGELATPKSTRGRRRVDLGPLVKKLIRPETAKPSDLIWENENYFTLQQQLRRLAKQVGIEFKGFGFHTLRRTYATMRNSMRLRPEAGLVTAMGHSDPGMTSHYVRNEDAGTVEQLQNVVYFSGISRDNSKLT